MSTPPNRPIEQRTCRSGRSAGWFSARGSPVGKTKGGADIRVAPSVLLPERLRPRVALPVRLRWAAPARRRRSPDRALPRAVLLPERFRDYAFGGVKLPRAPLHAATA